MVAFSTQLPRTQRHSTGLGLNAVSTKFINQQLSMCNFPDISPGKLLYVIPIEQKLLGYYQCQSTRGWSPVFNLVQPVQNRALVFFSGCGGHTELQC